MATKKQIIKKGDVKHEMYYVYFNPTDFPGKFVVRRQFLMTDGKILPEAEPLCIEDYYLNCLKYIPPSKKELKPLPAGSSKVVFKIFL